MTTPPRWKPRTIAAQALGAVDPVTRAVVPPLHVATTFVRDADNQYRAGYAYGRPDNATVRQTEAVIAALEGAHDALLFGSGMAAATAIVLALPERSHIVASQVMYWAFRHWLAHEAARFGHRVGQARAKPRFEGGPVQALAGTDRRDLRGRLFGRGGAGQAAPPCTPRTAPVVKLDALDAK